MALPRTKEVLASAATVGFMELARSAARADGAARKRVAAIVRTFVGSDGIELVKWLVSIVTNTFEVELAVKSK